MDQSPTDVFVCGGGPAGLAAAIAARAQGFKVTLADGSFPPIDKACGEGLMPDSVAALSELGVTIPTEQSFAFHGIRFLGADADVASPFPEGAGVGIRRTVLHKLLVERAQQIGVEMLWGTRVTGISADSVQLDTRRVQTRWVVGADGRNSPVRRWAGMESFRSDSSRYGFRRHYRLAPWTDHMEVYWAEGCQIYITPVSTDEVCVVLLSKDPHMRLKDAAPLFPRVMKHLSGAKEVEPERGAVSSARLLARVSKGNIALIGDASGSVDAITGEGLCLAFRQALCLASALRNSHLPSYENRHRRMMRRPVQMANFMLLMDRLPFLRERSIRALAARPGVFANLLATHVGDFDLSRLIMKSLIPLGIELVKA